MTDTVMTQRLVDELEIRNLVARLAQLADMGDLDEYVSLFTEDASWEMPGAPRHGRADIMAGAQDRRNSGTTGPESHTRHVISTLLVQSDGSDKATADSYWLFYGNTTTDARRCSSWATTTTPCTAHPRAGDWPGGRSRSVDHSPIRTEGGLDGRPRSGWNKHHLPAAPWSEWNPLAPSGIVAAHQEMGRSIDRAAGSDLEKRTEGEGPPASISAGWTVLLGRAPCRHGALLSLNHLADPRSYEPLNDGGPVLSTAGVDFLDVAADRATAGPSRGPDPSALAARRSAGPARTAGTGRANTGERRRRRRPTTAIPIMPMVWASFWVSGLDVPWDMK